MAEAGDPVEKFAVALEQPGVVSVAQTNSRFHERIEHQLEVESRTADHLEHLGGRRLLLQRLCELLFQIGIGCAKAVNASSRLRFLRTCVFGPSPLCEPRSPRRHSHWSPSGRAQLT